MAKAIIKILPTKLATYCQLVEPSASRNNQNISAWADWQKIINSQVKRI
jgi:hypothetical protein